MFEKITGDRQTEDISVEQSPDNLNRRVRVEDRIVCECRGQIKNLLQCLLGGTNLLESKTFVGPQIKDLVRDCQACAREGLIRIRERR